MPNGKFEELYKIWIEKAIQDNDVKVFTYIEKNEIVGFVTLSINKDEGYIGLIAVDPNFQGKNIGRQLINKCESFLFENKISKLNIPTQKNNISAVHFYSNLGYSIISEENIYHIIK